MKLTEREEAALRMYLSQGELFEGDLHEAWPLIRKPRAVADNLHRKGLVTFGSWDDVNGYELIFTSEGRAVATEMPTKDPS